MSARLRIAAVTVQVQLVADDGDNLAPVPVDPVTISGADWPNVVEIVTDAVARLQAQLDPPALLP